MFGLERDLEVMARDRLVEAHAGQADVASAGQVVRVDVVHAGPAAVDRRRVVVGGGRVLLLVRLHRRGLRRRLSAAARSSQGLRRQPARSGRGRGRATRRPTPEWRRGRSAGLPAPLSCRRRSPGRGRWPGALPRSWRAPRGRSGGARRRRRRVTSTLESGSCRSAPRWARTIGPDPAREASRYFPRRASRNIRSAGRTYLPTAAMSRSRSDSFGTLSAVATGDCSSGSASSRSSWPMTRSVTMLAAVSPPARPSRTSSALAAMNRG